MICVFSLLLLPSLSCSSVVQTAFGEVEASSIGLRKKPEMVEKWAPSRLETKEFGASCVAFTPWRVPGTTYSEDCLFLNIITPKLGGAKLPVFFYIHGGFYEVGSSTYLGYKSLAEKFASEGIVVVTINYRLGPFGFFSLGDFTAPGNLGLWDQTLALQFIHEILPSFGGDTSRITVAGHSAGSASASALQFSPDSNKLFSQAIMVSGSAMADFAQSEMVVGESKKLLRALDCPMNSTAAGLDCLRKFTPDEIIQTIEMKIGTSRRHPNVVAYTPRIDGDFFPRSIHELAKSAPKKRTLSGATDQESALFVLHEQMSWIAGIALTKAEQATFSRKNLIDFIERAVVTDQEYGKSADALRSLLVEFYAGKDAGKNSTYFLQKYSDQSLWDNRIIFLTIVPLHPAAQNKSFPRKDFAVQGAYHGDELEHFTDSVVLFHLKSIVELSTQMTLDACCDPSYEDFSWLPVTEEHPFQHAAITTNMSFRTETYRAEAARLWFETVPKIMSGKNARLLGA